MGKGNMKGFFIYSISIFLLASTEAGGADWRLLTHKAKDAYYFDADSIRTLDNQNIRVWGREILSEESKSGIIKNLGNAFTSLYSAGVFFEINCREKMIKAIMVEYYSNDGFMISAESYDGEWEIILPDTTQDALRKKICK